MKLAASSTGAKVSSVNTDKATRGWSLFKAVNEIRNGGQLTGLEAEMHQEAQNEARKSIQGIGLPTFMTEKRTIDQGTSAIAPVAVGAYVDSGTMVDSHALIGSCAQVGRNVHVSAAVQIGGVLEPIQAGPVIIEDNCFIGARSEVVEGVVIEENSVLSMGVFIGQSTKIYDRETGQIHYGRVPAGSVVVPGSLPSADGKYSLYAAIIVKKVDAQTRAKTAINELLRD